MISRKQKPKKLQHNEVVDETEEIILNIQPLEKGTKFYQYIGSQ